METDLITWQCWIQKQPNWKTFNNHNTKDVCWLSSYLLKNLETEDHPSYAIK